MVTSSLELRAYKATLSLTLFIFLYSLADEIFRESKPSHSSKVKEIKNLEKSIFAVATALYIFSIGNSDFRTIQKLRYLDWVITTPMLLKSLHLLAEERGFKGSFVLPLISNIFMIIFGYLHEFGNPESGLSINLFLGFLSFSGVLTHVKDWGTFIKSSGIDVDNLLNFFYVGWTAYGLNSLTPNEEIRQTIFNLLDIFNKFLYSIVIRDIITNKLESS